MKRYLILIAFALAITSCDPKEPQQPVKADAPVLLSTDPANGTADLTGSTITVKLTYDQTVKCPIDKQSGISVSGGAEIGKISAPGDYVNIEISSLGNGTSHTLNIPAGTIQGFKDNQEGAAAVTLNFSMKYIEPAPDPDAIPARGTNAAWQMAEKIGLGFNFGNNFDAYRNGSWAGDLQDVPDETCWGCDKITQQAMDKIKSYGFKSVRVPISWLKMIGPAPDYKLNEDFLKRIEEVVGYAEKAGLVCIINTHHDENHHGSGDTDYHWLDILGALNSAEKNTAIKNELNKVWTQIANRFKDKGEWLIFEPYNEINDGGWGWSAAFQSNPQAQYDILNQWAQVFVDAVRATGGPNATRWLAIPGYAANPGYTMAGLKLPSDSANKLMVTVHSYDPYNFNNYDSSYKSEWGHTADPAKRVSSDDERAIRKTMSELYAQYVKKGIPCFFGEFGSINRPTERERAFEKYWFEYFTKCARSFGLGAILWDNQSLDDYQMGYIHHGTGEYIREGKTMVGVMLKGMNTTDENYTLQTVYNNAPK